MNLKEFITNAIYDINDALVDIRENTGQGYEILPSARTHSGSNFGVVHFDVAVAASNEESASGQGKAGIGIKVLSIDAGVDAGVEAEAASTRQQQSRIVFDLVIERRADLKRVR